MRAFRRALPTRRLVIGGAATTAVAALILVSPLDARAGTSTLTPTAITTNEGSIGSGQSASNLAVKDLSGSSDRWNRYVEFIGQYSGFLTFAVPSSVPASSITAIQARVNYRGPATRTQLWTFKLYNWSSSTWVTIGTNATAPDWGSWKLLTFNTTGTMSSYVSGSNAMRLQLVANNARDAADIDYAALVLTRGPLDPEPSPDATTPSVAPSGSTAPSPGVSTTTSSAADTTAPSAPSNVAVTGTTSSSVSLSWSASTDNVDVTGYDVFQGSSATPVATANGTSATVAGLSPSTTYSFRVKARDAAGNRSPDSSSISATTAASTAGGLPASVACPGCWHPPLQVSWNWVISEVPNAPYRTVHMYDIDGFNASAADVAALHNAGKKVVCYLSVGTYEDWRPDAGRFPATILGSPLDDWPGERYLDIRNVQQPGSVLAQIMNDRLDMCDSKGFDAVEFDNQDAYTNSSGFPLTSSHQAYYNVWLANGAHARGMSAVLKNDIDQLTLLEPYYDMALNEECNAWDECDGYSVFIRAGKPVFNAEYGQSTGFCAADNAANINGVRLALDLDDSIFQPCR
jgi:hypothetical protein